MINRGKYIIVSIISIIVVAICIIFCFLLLDNNEPEEEEYPRVNIYKYEISSNKYKYFLDKLDVNKIALKSTIPYRCVDDNCTYANSLFALNNINGNKVLIIDDDNLLIYDFMNKKKNIIPGVNKITTADFINNSNYILINNNDTYYVYNSKKKTLSDSFKSDLLALKDENIEVVFSNGIITIDNGKYGIINLDTGNNIFDNVYDYIECNSKICLFEYENESTLFNSIDPNSDALISDVRKVLFFDEKYVLYNKTDGSYLYDIATGIERNVDKLDSNISIIGINSFNNHVVIDSNENNICYRWNIETNIKDKIDCSKKELLTDIYVSSTSKSNFTLTYGNNSKNTYELKVLNDKLYDGNGNFYDKVSIDSSYSDIQSNTNIINVGKDEAYSFLNELSDRMGLSNYERMSFINRWLSILINNGENTVYISISNKKTNIKDINIITDMNSYGLITMDIQKGFSKNATRLDNLNISKLDKRTSSVFTITG